MPDAVAAKSPEVVTLPMTHRGPALAAAPRGTADYIALHARRRPDHPAIISNGRVTTYAALDRELASMTVALAALGLAPCALVAVAHPDLHPRLLVMLAFERLGITVAPFRREEGEEAAALLAEADLVMSMAEIAQERCRRQVRMTPEWLENVLSHRAGGAHPGGMSHPGGVSHPGGLSDPGAGATRTATPDDALLLIRTSGSTGTPKQMIITRMMLAARLHRRAAALDLHRNDRFLATTPFTVALVYYLTLLHIRLGATVLSHYTLAHDAPGEVDLAALLERYRPTRMHMLPFHLATLLNQPRRLKRLPHLALIVSGGKLAPTLRQQAVDQLCGRIIQIYGTNETAMICTLDDDDLGTPLPGLALGIADDDGAGVPPDVVGEIRVQGAAVIPAYRDDPAATARALRHGWYYTGDFGFLTPEGRLMVLGRRDDVLNFGGIKRSAGFIEAHIQSLGVGQDIAVLSGLDNTGAPALVVCIACAERDFARLAEPVHAALRFAFTLHRVDAIPRSPDGKVRRALLQQAFSDRPFVSRQSVAQQA